MTKTAYFYNDKIYFQGELLTPPKKSYIEIFNKTETHVEFRDSEGNEYCLPKERIYFEPE